MTSTAGQRLHLRSDRGGGDSVRQHLRLHHSGAGDTKPDAMARSRGCCSMPSAPRRYFARDRLFWLTGVLSAALDNAPTYLVFFELAGGAGPMGPLAAALKAISMGAVCMGALSYGNAPNLMVRHRGRAQREDAGLLRLHRLGGAILLPALALVTVSFGPLDLAGRPRAAFARAGSARHWPAHPPRSQERGGRATNRNRGTCGQRGGVGSPRTSRRICRYLMSPR